MKIIEIIEGSSCDVHPFYDSHCNLIKSVGLINGIFATYTITGETIIVELNQALDFTKVICYSLLYVNQARYNRVIVDDVPKEYDNFRLSTFSITSPMEYENDIIEAPLHNKGLTSYINMIHHSDN